MVLLPTTPITKFQKESSCISVSLTVIHYVTRGTELCASM
ncbi:hypothetical protein BVRB_3g055510 [Beta vulgaris subsp. vulgaris]|nr:hypothetical protein BVRB_3g055510 [Beta vulgaris subsp. vulgaris]